MRLILKVVFFGIITFFCLLHVHPSRETSLQGITEYLTDLRLCLQQQVIKLSRTIFHNEKCRSATTDVNNNYDLSQYEHQCPRHRYITRLIERSPLIIYIEQFLTQNEIQYLITLAEPFLKPSMIFEDNGTYSVNQRRTSSSAHIKRHQTPLVKCIEQRFAQFQGDIDVDCMEPLQVVKYTGDQQFKPHYDWFSQPKLMINGGQRVTTFFTYLRANCSKGETEFLAIQFNKSAHERFCDILVCDEKSTELGIRFRPSPGNSIFWYNMDEHGEVDYLTYHAGRAPGKDGYKIGLNTWTRLNTFSLRS